MARIVTDAYIDFRNDLGAPSFDRIWDAINDFHTRRGLRGSYGPLVGLRVSESQDRQLCREARQWGPHASPPPTLHGATLFGIRVEVV